MTKGGPKCRYGRDLSLPILKLNFELLQMRKRIIFLMKIEKVLVTHDNFAYVWSCGGNFLKTSQGRLSESYIVNSSKYAFAKHLVFLKLTLVKKNKYTDSLFQYFNHYKWLITVTMKPENAILYQKCNASYLWGIGTEKNPTKILVFIQWQQQILENLSSSS